MSAYFKLQDFWRVGYHADPLSVSLEYQKGDGRYDDPYHEFTVLYAGSSAATCIFEVAMPWTPHSDATYVQQAEAPEADGDAELQNAELEQAERDREIAMRPLQMPQDLYEKAKVYASLSDPVILCDLDEISVRTELAAVPVINELMKAQGVPHLDRSVITAQGPYLDITRTISGYLMRNDFLGHRFAGIRTLSRHTGDCYVLFETKYTLGPTLVGPIRLTRDDSDVVSAALQLKLIP